MRREWCVGRVGNDTRYYEKVVPWKKISPQLMAKPRFLEYL